jgi:DNA-binding response OmpR family regulator
MHILLADDDPAIRRALSLSLTRAGYTVTAVDDGDVAIAMAAEQKFDIVIADYNMQRVGGVAVIRHFKQLHGANCCCVILSGDDDDIMNAACYMAGADDVLMKPLTPSELRERVASAARALRKAA